MQSWTFSGSQTAVVTSLVCTGAALPLSPSADSPSTCMHRLGSGPCMLFEESRCSDGNAVPAPGISPATGLRTASHFVRQPRIGLQHPGRQIGQSRWEHPQGRSWVVEAAYRSLRQAPARPGRCPSPPPKACTLPRTAPSMQANRMRRTPTTTARCLIHAAACCCAGQLGQAECFFNRGWGV